MRRLILPLVLLGACAGPLDDVAEARERYDRGRALLEKGQPEEAARQFAAGARLDPASAVLPQWEAHALLQAGDPAGAREALERVPEGARHGRWHAAWAAAARRLGDDAAARSALVRALEQAPDLGSALLADPDLGPLLEGPDAPGDGIGFTAVAAGEAGAILVGEAYDLELEVRLPHEATLRVVYEGPDGAPFAWLRAVEERETGSREVHLAWTLQALAPGEGVLGPWRVEVGRWSREVAAVPWQAVAPPGRATPEATPGVLGGSWPVPSVCLAGIEPPAVVPIEGGVLVVHAPGDRVEVDEDRLVVPPLRLEERLDARAVRAGVRLRPAEAVRIRVRRGARVILEEEVGS